MFPSWFVRPDSKRWVVEAASPKRMWNFHPQYPGSKDVAGLKQPEHCQSWFPSTTIGFIPDNPSQEQGILYIWIKTSLTEGDAYVAEIRVGGWSVNSQSPGTFHIGASDASHADIHHSGPSQTLSVFIPSVGGSLSLITIETKGLGGLAARQRSHPAPRRGWLK